MSSIQEVDRSIVVIFDIVGFTKNEPSDQVSAVDTFVEKLNNELARLEKLKPDAFSTGDGAIITIGRNCQITPQTTLQFLDFIISFVISLKRSKLLLRTAINYSERDNLILIDHLDSIQGDYIQIGDTINLAARILSFAEISEILINISVYDLMRKMGLLNKYNFIENEPFTTKHGEVINTFSYKPNNDETEFLYDPTCPSHQYKKYNYFPPVNSEIINYFLKTGLDYELNKIISNSYDSIKEINVSRQFISYSPVLEVLMQLNYDPTDTVYILNRQDRKYTFWTQSMKQSYVRYLQSIAKNNNDTLNQIRIRVYDYTKEETQFMPDQDIYWDIVDIHNNNTYYTLPSNILIKYPHLNELIFGATVSSKYKYAIIPIPSPESMEVKISNINNIGKTLELLKEYDISHGPMKAIIISDMPYVENLINEFQQMIMGSHVNKFK